MSQQSAVVRKTKAVGAKEYPLKNKWDLRTDLPQKLLIAISDAIEDTGYRIKKNPVRSKQIFDTTNFTAEFDGSKRLAYVKSRPLIIGIPIIVIAVILFLLSVPGDISDADIAIISVGVVVCVVGVMFCDAGLRRYKLSLIANIRSQASRVGDAVESSKSGREISEVHLEISCHIKGRRVNWANDSREVSMMKTDFRELEKRAVAALDSLKIN